MVNSFKVSDDIRLMNNLQHAYFYTTRDEYFPEHLHKMADQITLAGDLFQISAGFSSRSDRLFDGFNTITITGSGDYRVWRSGPHSIHVGIMFSSRGELWNLSLPLPMIAYRHRAHNFFINAGLPLLMVWRPHEKISLVLSGMLPCIGSARVYFNIHRYFSLSMEWSYRREPFYLIAYPYRDVRYAAYFLKEALNYNDESEEKKKFILESQRAGVTLSYNYDSVVSIFIFNGFRFSASYYMTNNILARGAAGRERIRDSYIMEAGARCGFSSGGITQ